MKIIASSHCNNSPKNKFVETYSISLLTKDVTELQLHSSDPMSIILPDGKEIKGLSELENWHLNAEILTSIAAISHGKQGSFLGLLTNGKTERYLTIYYEFKTLKADKMSKVIVFEGNELNKIL